MSEITESEQRTKGNPKIFKRLPWPKMLVAIALANKMARTVWAVLTKEEDYRDPANTVAA